MLLAPLGLGGFFARRAEVQAARAAGERGAGFCLSTLSVCAIEELSGAMAWPFWFQLYIMKDRGIARELLARAAAARCPVLVLTVDLPVAGARYRDTRSGLARPPGVLSSVIRANQMLHRPGWLYDVGLRGGPHRFGNLVSACGEKATLEQFYAWIGDNFDASVTWNDLEWLRAHWSGPIVIKGILDVDDARIAATLGVDGIVVSNHGGRQLDGVPSAARALPAIADAVGDRLTLLADGGVRSGLDVLRLLALGARSVLVGRPWAYAVAAGGEKGVGHLLDLIAAELRVALALTGCLRARDANRSLLVAD